MRWLKKVIEAQPDIRILQWGDDLSLMPFYNVLNVCNHQHSGHIFLQHSSSKNIEVIIQAQWAHLELECSNPYELVSDKKEKNDILQVPWLTKPRYRIFGSRTAINFPSRATHCDIISFSASRCITCDREKCTVKQWKKKNKKSSK